MSPGIYWTRASRPFRAMAVASFMLSSAAAPWGSRGVALEAWSKLAAVDDPLPIEVQFALEGLAPAVAAQIRRLDNGLISAFDIAFCGEEEPNGCTIDEELAIVTPSRSCRGLSTPEWFADADTHEWVAGVGVFQGQNLMRLETVDFAVERELVVVELEREDVLIELDANTTGIEQIDGSGSRSGNSIWSKGCLTCSASWISISAIFIWRTLE